MIQQSIPRPAQRFLMILGFVLWTTLFPAIASVFTSVFTSIEIALDRNGVANRLGGVKTARQNKLDI